MSVQREVELSGTLMSPDMAKISSEVAGVVREVRVSSAPRSEPATSSSDWNRAS
jgi:hypothetical protein